MYEARRLTGTSLEDIKEQATKGLDGSLDSGMGYESLIGAVLQVHIITKIEIEDKIFENIEYETISVGELTDEQYEFLENQIL